MTPHGATSTTEGRLLPVVDLYSAPFWEGTKKGKLRVQACATCGHLRFPPRPYCPACTSAEDEWHTMSGKGSIWSFVIAHPPVLDAYLAFTPYNVIVVELAEDKSIRMVGNLVSGDSNAPNSVDTSKLVVGSPVQVTFETVTEDITLPLWTLDEP